MRGLEVSATQTANMKPLTLINMDGSSLPPPQKMISRHRNGNEVFWGLNIRGDLRVHFLFTRNKRHGLVT